MSWGSAAEGASAAGSGTSSVGSAASGAGGAIPAGNGIGGAAGSTGSIYGSMADMGGSTTQPASGFSLEVTGGAKTGTGPTVMRADALDKAENLRTYGDEDPGLWDYTKHGVGYLWDKYQRYNKGYEEGSKFGDMDETGAGLGNNPESWGYFKGIGDGLFGELAGMGGGSKGGAAPITTNISYQQPENEYLRKRRGY